MADKYENERYIRTFSGRAFHLLGTDPAEIGIGDIAHALSHTGRFSGHTERFYSVAEHSLLVTSMVGRTNPMADEELLLGALLHDASEAYLTDIPSPFKGALNGYEELEERVWHRIADRFGVPRELHPAIKEADRIALFTEALALQPRGNHTVWVDWERYGAKGAQYLRDFGIPNMTFAEAKSAFLEMFHKLSPQERSRGQ